MKQLSLTIIILGFVFNGFAQQKATAKAVIKTPTVHCELCKDRIESYLSREYGILSSKVDVKKKTTTVTWLTDRTNIEQIKTAIANEGYDADNVKAEETAFNMLPKACQVRAPVVVMDSTKKN